VAGALYATAAARLLSELRRTVLAVRDYRTPPVRPQITKIEQQNVAHRQDVNYVAARDGTDKVPLECGKKSEPDSELASNIHAERNFRISKGHCGQEEPTITPADHGCRSAKAE
jgi:hypothetical protein